jgi:peptidoglycan hydrolase-like protein with peptidoglycan-binding domain
MLTPPRDLSDAQNLQESVKYWRTRRQASSNTAIPAAGGATALALIAATTLPALTGGHGEAAKSGRASASGAGTRSTTASQLVHHATTPRRASFGTSPTSGLGATAVATTSAPAATTQSLGKVIYGSVASVQRMLGLSADGKIGPATTAAIVQFQSAHGLPANGIVDQATFDAMQAAEPQQTTPIAASSAGGVQAHAANAAAAITAPVVASPTGGSPAGSGGATAPSASTDPGTSTTATPAADTTTTTTAADTSAATQPAVPAGVPALQAALHIQVDGTFGPSTQAAVEAFQASHGLAADGVVGPQTRDALGLGAGPTLRDTQPPPPPPAPANTEDSSSDAAVSTPAATDGDASDTSSTTSTSTSTGEPSDVAVGLSEMESAADSIATLPYIWGGGHGSWVSPGYDCSGSVSYVLHAAGLLSAPETSGDFESYGAPGPGRYVTIYATDGHVWMTIDGRRYDTVALAEDGSRWGPVSDGEFDGYVVRHPVGY